MRKFFVIPIILFTFFSFGQTSYEPFKKANTVLIVTNINSSDAFVNWGRHLVRNGFAIDKSHKDFLTLTTQPKSTSKLNYHYVINSTVMDNGTIVLKVKWKLKSNVLREDSETEFNEWEYSAKKNFVQNVIYGDLLRTIESFGKFQIQYEKR